MDINLSEKFAAIKGRRVKVITADNETCLKAILIRPSPFNRRLYNKIILKTF